VKEGRNAIAYRLASYLRFTTRKHYMPTLEFLARELGVCERTVRRDLEALEYYGVTFPQWRVFPKRSEGI
jgi:predicted DNA-binding transcriptional regulator YafY